MSAEPVSAAFGTPPILAEEVLGSMQRLMGAAPSVHAESWPWEERAEAIAVLDRVSELIGVYRSALLSAHKEDGRWARRGDRSFEGYRGRTAHTGWGEARREMEVADGLRELPQAARAVEQGDVGLAHAGVLGRLHARASEPVRKALTEGGADELLEQARGMDAGTFAKRAQAWAAARDAAAVERSHAQARAARYCRVQEREGGTRVEAFLDVVAGATVRTALEALTPVPAAGDERTSDQRRADALTTMAARVVDRGADKIGAQIRPHLSLLVPAETWAEMREQAENPANGPGSEAPPAATGSGEPAEVRRLAMPELDDGGVVPLSVIERIACDCEMTRIVLDADAVPLNVGRTERTYSKALRRAVLVRDRHCRWPGCTMRASWCEVHHVKWYSNGGPTSLDNGLTLCSFHHHEVHRRKVEIRPDADGHTFTLRDGTVIGESRRLPSGLLIPRLGRDGPDVAEPERERAPEPSTEQPPTALW